MAIVTRLAEHNNGKGLTQKEAIDKANRMGARVLSNKELDGRLVLTDTWKSEREVYGALSGTCVAYASPGKKLGSVIKYADKQTGTAYVFEVPIEYKNEANAILAVEHGFLANGKPTFSYERDGKNMLLHVEDKGKIALLPDFPTMIIRYPIGSTHIPDEKFSIPLGRTVSFDLPNARTLYRDNDYVGLLVRGFREVWGMEYRFGAFDRKPPTYIHREIFANTAPSRKFGALITDEPVLKVA